MDLILDKNFSFELCVVDGSQDMPSLLIKKKRMLIGRSQTCDIVIPRSGVTAIHGIIEVLSESKCRIYDMNSTNGIFINKKKILAEDLILGDEVTIGLTTFILQKLDTKKITPPPLVMLKNMGLPPVMDKKGPRLPKENPLESGSAERSTDALGVPRVEYPLAKDPNAEFSEYIFEDADTLYPIFKYSVDKISVEVIILFQDQIYSVDYLPVKNGTYSLAGVRTSSSDVEYAYLGKNEKLPFVEVQNGSVNVHAPYGYEKFCVGGISDTDSEIMGIDDGQILRFSKGDLQIFVRQADAPPQVAAAPVLRRDPELKKYMLLIFLLVFSVLGLLANFEVDKELEKEKAPERLARILYQKKIAKKKKEPKVDVKKITKQDRKIVKKLDPNKNKNKSNQKVKAADKKPIKVVKAKTGSKRSKKVGKVKKASPNKARKNVKKLVVKPKSSKAAGKRKSRRGSRQAPKLSKSKGNVDSYKSFDFKSTMSNLLAKGGSVRNKKSIAASESNVGYTTIDTSESGATLVRAKVSKNVGSLQGATTGKLDSSRGVQGIVRKKSIHTFGMPYKTVVLGGMDPDIIQQILRDHIPQFRYCYQSVLDTSKRSFSGIIHFNFIIGASGHVTKAAVNSKSYLPSKVKGCVINVIRGIKFPEPLGGGVAEVNQPFNFYPNVK